MMPRGGLGKWPRKEPSARAGAPRVTLVNQGAMAWISNRMKIQMGSAIIPIPKAKM